MATAIAALHTGRIHCNRPAHLLRLNTELKDKLCLLSLVKPLQQWHTEDFINAIEIIEQYLPQFSHPHVASAFLIQTSALSSLSKGRNTILFHSAHGDIQHL